MSLGRITLVPERKWSLDLVWIVVPLTAACGYWELGGWESLAWFMAVLTNVLLGIVIVIRLLGYTVSIATRDRMFVSFVKGAAYAAAMFYAWPTEWVGPVYLILLFTTLCLMEIRRPKG